MCVSFTAGPGGYAQGEIKTTPNVVYGIRENQRTLEESEDYHYAVVQ